MLVTFTFCECYDTIKLLRKKTTYVLLVTSLIFRLYCKALGKQGLILNVKKKSSFLVTLHEMSEHSPFEEMLRPCEMAAGAGGAGSIFQGAQQEAGENSGVGPADINMVEPPSD